jgi:sulfotransferase
MVQLAAMKAIHFISGMPRSGSTLLSALLRQNPAFHAGVSSPVLAMVNAVHTAMGPAQEWAPLVSDSQRVATMRAVVQGFYEDKSDRVVFDTSRGWCSRMATIVALFPDARVVASVREYAWVIDSFERVYALSPLATAKLFNPEAVATLYSRVEAIAAPNGVVGFAWNALREAVYGEHRSRLIIVDYEALTREPARTMEYLYAQLELPAFRHDFESVELDGVDEFDAHLGAPGLHRVRRKVEFVERETILPPDVFYRFRGNDYWKAPDFASLGIPMCIRRRP